jgi:UDP-N-acetylglucosamine 2-epimerase
VTDVSRKQPLKQLVATVKELITGEKTTLVSDSHPRKQLDNVEALKFVGKVIVFKLTTPLNVEVRLYTALPEQVGGRYTFCKLEHR